MSLIELLVALSISTVILVVAISVYVTASSSLSRHQQQRWRRQPVVEALDMLQRDLACCCTPANASNSVFDLEYAGSNATLLCWTAGVAPEQKDISRFDVQRVRYSVRNSEKAGGGVLVREVLPLTASDAVSSSATADLVSPILAFQVWVLADNAWTNRWRRAGSRSLPRAARVRLNCPTVELESEVWIPAGNTINAEAARK